MKRRFPTDGITALGVLADILEQVLHDVRRMAAAVKAILDEVKDFYDVLSALMEWLKSKQASYPPATA